MLFPLCICLLDWLLLLDVFAMVSKTLDTMHSIDATQKWIVACDFELSRKCIERVAFVFFSRLRWHVEMEKPKKPKVR